MNYNSLLKFLYFEGYTDSYAEAEILVESLSDDEFDELCEKYVKALDTTGKGPDHRTRFPRFRGRDDEFDPQFVRQRVDQNEKRIDPYFSGRRKRKTERRQGTGGTRVTEATEEKTQKQPVSKEERKRIRQRNAKIKQLEVLAKHLSDPLADIQREEKEISSPRPTRLPKSREQSHDDWKDQVPTEWEQRSPQAKRLATRLIQTVGTQRRQDQEVGLREENKRDEYLRKQGEWSKDAAMRKSRERRGRFSSGETHSNAERENITWTRPGTRSYDDSLQRQRKAAHKKARKVKKSQPGTSSEQRRLDAIWQSRFPEDRPKGEMEKLTSSQIAQRRQGVLRQGERRRELRTQAVTALRRAGINVTEELVNYLLVNSYVNDRHSALNLLESMSDAWFEEILESSGMSKENRQTWNQLTQKYGSEPFTAMLKLQKQEPETTTKSAKRAKPITKLTDIHIGQ